MARPTPDKMYELIRAGWTKEDEIAFEKELQGTSDRAAALIAAAYLEGTVEFALRRAIRSEPSKGDEMILFGTSGALASFAVKVRLAHLLHVFGPITRQGLLDIISIRNRFAHSAKALSFEHEAVVSLCNALKVHSAYAERGLVDHFQEGFQNIPTRIKFLSTCMDIEGTLRKHVMFMERMYQLELKRDIHTLKERKGLGKSVKVLRQKYDGLP